MAALKRELAPYEENDFSQQMDVILAIVDAQPAADVAPVVRCQECRYSSLPSGFTQRYGEPGTLSCHYGPCNRRNVKGDDFCSYGQRKEDGHA